MDKYPSYIVDGKKYVIPHASMPSHHKQSQQHSEPVDEKVDEKKSNNLGSRHRVVRI